MPARADRPLTQACKLRAARAGVCAAKAPLDVPMGATRRQSDFLRILTEPDHNMLRQQQALLGTEGVALEFAHDAVEEIAALAEQVTGIHGV